MWSKVANFDKLFLCGCRSKSSINSPFTQTKTNIENKYLKKNEKNPKNLFGVFAQVKIGLKKSSCKKKPKLEKERCEQTPQTSKKKGLRSLKN